MEGCYQRQREKNLKHPGKGQMSLTEENINFQEQ